MNPIRRREFLRTLALGTGAAAALPVFAKSDMIHLQQIATKVEDIVAGLCFAVARNFKGSIAKGREARPPVAFQGGVAANRGMVRAFREVFELEELFVPPDYALMGALGAAMKDRDEGLVNLVEPGQLDRILHHSRFSDQGYDPLVTADEDFFDRLSHPQQPRGVGDVLQFLHVYFRQNQIFHAVYISDKGFVEHGQEDFLQRQTHAQFFFFPDTQCQRDCVVVFVAIVGSLRLHLGWFVLAQVSLIWFEDATRP